MRVKEKSEKDGLKLNIQESKIMTSCPTSSLQIGEKWKQWLIAFTWAPKSLGMVIVPMTLRDTWSLEEKLWQT